jgi:hypothetical protein
MKVDRWKNCYPSQWKGVIIDRAFEHPAKFSSKLVKRIYAHLIEEGWVKPGDTVLDPFGGVALGAINAMHLGMNWIGVELEPKFVELGGENIELWNETYSQMPGWNPNAVLLQGDSRELVRVVDEACDGSVSSPPYNLPMSQDHNGSRGGRRGTTPSEDGAFVKYGNSDGQLEGMPMTDEGFQASITSPPFLQSEGGTPEPKEGGPIDKSLYKRHSAGNSAAEGYGGEEGQLGNMRGSEQGFHGAVSSPPYTGSMNQSEGANDTEARIERMRKAGIDVDKKENVGGPAGVARKKQNYGSTPGQLGAMKACISSPPYADGAQHTGGKDPNPEHIQGGNVFHPGSDYGVTSGQLGAMPSKAAQSDQSDFWAAARVIVEQTYALLAPGAHAVWVVKDFVKNKERVPFSHQWRQLCEAVGFETLHEHRAMLVHHKGTQETLFGEPVEIKTESKSFFRRLAEKKGSPRIDWETVYCMVKNP